ncbi:hypothetical protein KUV47_21055 [Vannielia litorea]|uniref:hypothetical protein n=1 Tax=Vannielia litorea TaxID=1217970 RepID=UPI001C963FCF|nr:hypothetical protein [Vannielia litorea]MBY6155719.1 hypothetical protein [Vannielia litorea]
MTVELIHDQDTCQLVFSIRAGGLLPGAKAANSMSDLEAALPLIAEAVEQGDHYFYAIDASGKWRPEQGEFDPMGHAPNVAAWGRLLKFPDLFARMEAWFGEVEKLLASRQGDGIFEHDEIHFAELPISTFALAHRHFVPAYTRIMAQWDMDHEVNQEEVIAGLVRRHGITPETEELLYLRTVEVPGQVGEGQVIGLLDELNAHYGDFTTSPLFYRIVEAMYHGDREARLAAITEVIRRRKTDPEAKLKAVHPWEPFTYGCPPELTQAAARLWAELEIAAGPLPKLA